MYIKLIGIVNWYSQKRKYWLSIKFTSLKNVIAIAYYYFCRFLRINFMNFNLVGVLINQ